MIDVKKFVRGAGMAGALGFGSLGMVLGIGVGTANAAPPSPVGPTMDWAQDRGWGHGKDWRDRGWRDHDRGWHGGPRSGLHINLPCVTGPHGIVTWCP